MSDKKIDEIESMFKKAAKPKLNIDEINPPGNISVLYDGTDQGKNALLIAARLAKKFHIPLRVIAADDYFEAFKSLAVSTNEKIQSMMDYADNFTKENEVASEVHSITGDRIEKFLAILEEENPDEAKLSNKIVKYLKEELFDIVVTGAPLFKVDTEESYFGYYLTKILRESHIHSNILVVSDKIESLTDTILSFVNVDQQPNSIVALTRRSLSLSQDETKIKLIGMVEDKIIETVARAELEDDQSEEDLNLMEVRNRLKNKMQDTLSSISIEETIEYGSFEFSVETGVVSAIIKRSLEDTNPGLVLVRSVSRLDENLDPVAEQITRAVLQAGYPVLLVWD